MDNTTKVNSDNKIKRLVRLGIVMAVMVIGTFAGAVTTSNHGMALGPVPVYADGGDGCDSIPPHPDLDCANPTPTATPTCDPLITC